MLTMVTAQFHSTASPNFRLISLRCRQAFVACVSAGQINWPITLAYHRVTLTVLFRNPCHIASFSTKFINHGHLLLPWSATVTGTYVIEQTQIACEFYEDNQKEDLINRLIQEHENLTSGALIVFGSDQSG